MTKSFIILTLFVLFALAAAWVVGIIAWLVIAAALSLAGIHITLSPVIGGLILWLVFGTVRLIIQQRKKK